MKSSKDPVGSEAFQQLSGNIADHHGADQGLLVAWGGLTRQAKELSQPQGFRIRSGLRRMSSTPCSTRIHGCPNGCIAPVDESPRRGARVLVIVVAIVVVGFVVAAVGTGARAGGTSTVSSGKGLVTQADVVASLPAANAGMSFEPDPSNKLSGPPADTVLGQAADGTVIGIWVYQSVADAATDAGTLPASMNADRCDNVLITSGSSQVTTAIVGSLVQVGYCS